jgi:hypothetical protein
VAALELVQAVEGRATSRVPDPLEVPVLPLWPDTAKLLDLGRSAVYQAAARGEIPTLAFGSRKVVPTAALRRLLQIDDGPP